MAYDPKSFLQQALKQGFEPRYESTGASPETGQAAEQYAGDEARFGNVVVRPLQEFVGASEQDVGVPQQTGYSVSAPLSGQYAGYFRNDLYDNEGNFLRTTISEPDTDKYGLKDLARLGLTAASFGGLGPAAQMISKTASGIAALKSGDPLRILSAVSNIPGAGNVIPSELKTLADYAGKAGQVQSALKGDPNAIFGLITGAGKSGVLPKGVTGEVDMESFDQGLIPGLFEPGGEGFDTSQIPDYLGGQTGDVSFDTSQIPDYLGGLPPDDTGTTLPTDNETVKFLRQQELAQSGESPLGGIGVNAKELPLINLSDETSKVGGKKTTTPASKQGLDLQKLAFLLGMMQQKPKEKEEAQASQEFPVYSSLMYGLPGRYEG